MSNYEQTDALYRAEMVRNSEMLLDALRRQHPRIIHILTHPARRKPS